MAFAWTYSTLTAQILNFSERADADFAATIDIIISLAEYRIAKEAKVLLTEQYIVGTFLAGQPIIQKPNNWRNTLSINYGSGTDYNTRSVLLQRSYDYIREFWPNDTLTGPPLYYGDTDYQHWIIAPTPDQAYPFEVCYEAISNPLDATNQTNFLTLYAPELLFYACMVEANIYLKNFDERLQNWKDQYQNALQSFLAEDKTRMIDRSADRDKD